MGGVKLAWLAAWALAVTTLVSPPATAHPGPDLAAYPWLYLRAGRPPAADEQLVQLLAVGDVMLGRGVDCCASNNPLTDVSPWLRSADVTFGNLEGVITDAPCPDAHAAEDGQPGKAAPRAFCLAMPPASAQVLSGAGFDVLSLANNHAMDFGSTGLMQTVSYLSQAGIAASGVISTAETIAPVIVPVKGLRLAFLAFNMVPYPGQRGAEGWAPAAWQPTPGQTAIATARHQADVVVVSVHWGYEYEANPDPAQREAARLMLEAGADLVIGHHPHVVQHDPVTALQRTPGNRTAWVAYSLGNFVFDQEWTETRQGLALRAFFDRDGLRALQAIPVRAGLRPRLLSAGQAEPLLQRLTKPVRLHFFACTAGTCQGFEPVNGVTLAHIGGRFTSGGLDLTGDGLDEWVRLEDEGAVIYAQPRRIDPDASGTPELWRSPAEWRITDLALGDPNDDGRGELLLAFWKQDEKGAWRSHPFIIGYREGIYRTLWGGSAVANPLLEVELADLDGDLTQELVVLEAGQSDRERTVAVWRWNGWGFSLVWRSQPGAYRELGIVPARNGQPTLIGVAE